MIVILVHGCCCLLAGTYTLIAELKAHTREKTFVLDDSKQKR